MSASTDKAGTVRVNPKDVTEAAAKSHDAGAWVSNKSDHGMHFRTDWQVEPWDIVYEPPRSVGTVMFREITNGPGGPFELAIMLDDGWHLIGSRGSLGGGYDEAPYDDEQGSWDTLREG